VKYDNFKKSHLVSPFNPLEKIFSYDYFLYFVPFLRIPLVATPLVVYDGIRLKGGGMVDDGMVQRLFELKTKKNASAQGTVTYLKDGGPLDIKRLFVLKTKKNASAQGTDIEGSSPIFIILLI